MSTIAKLAVEVGLDSGPLDKGLKDTREKVDKEGRNWTETFKNTGQKFTLGVTTPIVAGFGMMISMASDTSESMSAVETVYGDASTAIIDASKMSARAMGISQNEFLAGASTLGVFAQSAGLTGDAMSSFSTDLIGASADLASFYNANQPEVMDALKSGLMGEAEPLRKFGILLSDTAVNQYAWTHGIAATGEELTDQQKIAARYGFIMENLGAASGDFERTSGGLANTLRILKARVKDVAAQFGKYLLPMTLKWAKGAGVLIKWVEGLSDSQKKLILILGVVAAAIGPVLIGLSMMIPAISLLLGPVGLVIAAIAALGIAYKTNFLGFGDLVNTAVGKIADFVSKIVMIGKAMKDAFMEGKPISELVKQFPAPLQSVAEKALKVADAFGDIYSRFKSGGFSAMMDILPSKLKAAGNAALGLGKDLLNGIKGAIEGVNWDTAGEDLGAGARNLAIALGKGFWKNKEEIGKWVIKAVLALPALTKYIAPKAYEFIKGFVKGLDINWPLIWNWMKKMPSKAVAALGNMLPVLVQKGKDLLSGMKVGIEDRWPQLAGWLNGLATRAINAVGNLIGSLVQQGKDLITGLSTGVHNRWIDLRAWIATIPDLAVAAIGKVAGKLVQAGRDLLGGLKTGLDEAWSGSAVSGSSGIKGWISGLPNLMLGALTNSISRIWNSLYNAGWSLFAPIAAGINKAYESLVPKIFRDIIGAGGSAVGQVTNGMTTSGYSVSGMSAASGPYAAASPSSSSPITIIVQGYNKDPHELTNEIATTLSREFRLAGGFSLVALNTLRVGIYDKQADSDTINIQRFRSFFAGVSATKNGWMIGIGWWGGRAGGSTPDVTAAVYVNAGVPTNTPYSRIAHTTEVSNGTTMLDSSGGTRYERILTQIDVASSYPRSGTKMPVFAGTGYTLGLLAETAILRYSVKFPTLIAYPRGATEERGSLTNPPGSYTPTTNVTPGYQEPTLYLYGYENEPPLVPTNILPFTIEQSLTPTFTSDFRDMNGTWGDFSGAGVDTGDAVGSYQIQVRETSETGTLMWNEVFTASSGESIANATSRVYSGTTLTRGNTYYHRIRHRDLLGDWGPYSAWTSFIVALRGYVTLDGAPTGKVLVNTGITFNGKWFSNNTQAADRVQIRLLASDQTTVLQTSPVITKAVAHAALPGTAFTISWAESTFTNLAWNRTYYYQIQGRDSSGQWSGYSLPRSFNTDGAPNTPSSLSPANGSPWSTFPKLSAVISDPDDVGGGSLTGVFRITRPNATTVDVTPTWNGTTGKFEFQTTVTELSMFGTYSFRATGYDGTLYTGEATSLGSATWSNSASFQYLSGPAVTITAPADNATVATSSLTVTWTVTGQVSRQVRLYNATTGALVFDSGNTATGTLSYTIPAGSYRNNTSYTLSVSVTNATPLTGTSSITVNIAYTPADVLSNPQFLTERYSLDQVDSGVSIRWDQTSYALSGDPRFLGYSVYRTIIGDPTGVGRVRLAFIENPGVTSFTDPHPPSGFDVLYEVSQSIYFGADTVDGVVSSATLQIDLGQFHILSLLENPTTFRAVLTNVSDKPVDDVDDQTAYPSLGGGPPVTVYGPTFYETRDLAANIIAYGSVPAEQFLAALVDLRAQLGTVCYRDGAGNKAFYAMTDVKYVPMIGDTSGRWYTAAISLREENVSEGELSG